MFLICLLSGARTAAAQPDPALPGSDCADIPACVERVQSARELSNANQLNAALQSYESAYEQWKSPWLLINIGRIQQKLGRPADAIGSYRRYLDSSAGDQPERVQAARGYLKQAEQDLIDKRLKEDERAKRAMERPAYKKWWFWVAIGGGAVAVAAITAGAVVGASASSAGDRAVPANTGVFTF